MHQHVPYGTHLDLINGVQNDEFRTSQETLKTFKLDACNVWVWCCLFSFYHESEQNRLSVFVKLLRLYKWI